MCKERGYVLMAKLLDLFATVANIVRPSGKQTNMAPVLPDRVGRAPVGLELDDESLERLLNFHAWPPWSCGLEFEACPAQALPTLSPGVLSKGREISQESDLSQ
jgi:hypothetical protein